MKASESSSRFETINQLDSLTVFAPLDGVLSDGNRKLLQEEGNGNRQTDAWGAYMVPSYLDFD